jgi:hypothetical protein
LNHLASDPSVNLDHAFVFSAHPLYLRPWQPNWVTKEFIRQRRNAGLEHFRLHDLRHFMATEMLGAGVAVPVVSARLAHARASTTLNVYAHAIPGGDIDAAQLISGIVSSGQARLAPADLHSRVEDALRAEARRETDQRFGISMSRTLLHGLARRREKRDVALRS